MMMLDVSPNGGPQEVMWQEVERAVLALTLDDADPRLVQSTLEAAVSRCTTELEASGLALSSEGRARLVRARRVVREAIARRDDRGAHLRHAVGNALTAVMASLDVAAASLEEDTVDARQECVTAVGYAREAASRAVDCFQKLTV